MLNILIPIVAAIACYLATQRSLKLGLCAVLTVGYLYGITRANVGGTGTYLMFDFAAIAVYAAEFTRRQPLADRTRLRELKFWTAILMMWPALLFVIFLVFPKSDPLVELVGLRANIFLLPFLLLGARLDADDVRDLALYIAVLNLGAVGVGAAEFMFGIERFYPLNETTELIYRSHDLVGYTAHRIPGTFVNAHAFAGTLATSLPFVLGAWTQPQTRRWAGPILGAAGVASLLGIFMAAARTHMITAAVLGLIMSFTGGLSRGQWLRWVAAMLLVGYVVGGDARLQRFTTLTDQDTVTERVGGSVNSSLLEVSTSYPLGNGLTSGGTSVPYFLKPNPGSGMVLENEYARISLEQGVPGLLLWVFFIAWVLSRRPGRFGDSWLLGRRLAWAACLSLFGAGMLGIGMMASIPQTAVMLMLIGWFTSAPAASKVAEHDSVEPAGAPVAARTRRLRPAVAAGGRRQIHPDFDWTPPER